MIDNKKIYIKPECQSIIVDVEISLIMMTVPPIWGGSASEGNANEETPSATSNPFGGDSPEYPALP